MTESQANYLLLLADQAELERWKYKYKIAIENRDWLEAEDCRRLALGYIKDIKADLQRVELYREGFIE